MKGAYLRFGFVPAGLTVDGAEFPFMSTSKNLLVKNFCFLILSLFQVTASQVILGFSYIGVIRAKFAFVNLKCTLVVPFDFLVFTLILKNKMHYHKIIRFWYQNTSSS